MDHQPLLSILLSFRNEEQVLPELIRRLRAALESIPIDFELLFINDASTDRSLEILAAQAQADPRIKIINMSRRFGVFECISAGLTYSRGDAVVMMDSDLQDPPELLPALVEKWRAGADVVYTVRTARHGEAPLKMSLTKIAYWLIGHMTSEIDLKKEVGDFRLMSRRAVNELLRLKERNPYIRGLVAWLGFRQEPVYYERDARAGGMAHFSLFRHFFRDLGELRGPIGHLISGMTSFSIFPMLFFLLAGALVCGASVLWLLSTVLLHLFDAATPPNYLASAIVFLAGVQLLGIGTLGIYLGRVYNEVKNRPQYIVESTIGLPVTDSKGIPTLAAIPSDVPTRADYESRPESYRPQ